MGRTVYTEPQCLYKSSLYLVHFPHDRPNWCPSFSNTIFHNFPSISDLQWEMSRYGEELNTKFCTSFVSTLNLRPICWSMQSSGCRMLLLAWRCWIYFRMYILHHLLSLLINKGKSNTTRKGIVLLFYYMYRPFFIRPSSGRRFFVEETVQFYVIP